MVDEGEGAISNSNTTTTTPLQIRVGTSVNCSNFTFVPELFDLTAIFGAGNEPATIAEFEEVFGK